MLACRLGPGGSLLKRYLIYSAALTALLVAAGLYESRLAPAARARDLPTGAAEWIWPAGLDAHDGWVSFFVYRDFEIGPSAPERAELVVQADAGYWAFVNGTAVGSGGFRERAPADAYEVGAFLRPGSNRLVFQARSRRGVGGLLARLDLGAHGSVVTDETWKACRRYENALLGAGFVPEDVEYVRSWGAPPVGAWEVEAEAVRVPILADQLLSARPAGAARIRALGQRDWDRRFPEPESRMPLGRWVMFDLGREIDGYVNVVFATRSGSRGLIYTGLDRPFGPDSADPDAYFASPAGRGSWTDPQPRRFRYVTVLALSDIAGLRVFETASDWVVARGAGERRSRRAFSFEPPPSVTTVEDEFRSELKRVTGLTGREAFESGLGG